jgi:ribonuclease HII
LLKGLRLFSFHGEYVTMSLCPRKSLSKSFHSNPQNICRWVIGVDEVGVGCLAGPVVASAVIYCLDEEWVQKAKVPCRIADSKLLSEKQLLEAEGWLKAQSNFRSIVCEAHPTRIDEVNIYWARMEVLAQAVLSILSASEGCAEDELVIYVDGPVIPPLLKARSELRIIAESKADLRYFPVAAASIIAKNHRDTLMTELAKTFPVYGWERNVGYATSEHREALREHGMSPWHRRSFSCL